MAYWYDEVYPSNEVLCIYYPSENGNITLNKSVNFNEFYYQSFDFPSTIIYYLMSTNSNNVFKKLNETCKYFFAKKNIISVPFLLLTQNQDSHKKYNVQHKIFTRHTPKLWITQRLFICGDFNILSIGYKIYHCVAHDIAIIFQDFREIEFDFLINPYFVTNLRLKYTFIKKSDGNYMVLEEIAAMVPCAENIWFEDIHTTKDTCLNLSKLTRKSKLKRFAIYMIKYTDFNPRHFCNFAIKNAAEENKFQVAPHRPPKHIMDVYKNQVKQFLRKVASSNTKPNIYFTELGEYYTRHFENSLLQKTKDLQLV